MSPAVKRTRVSGSDGRSSRWHDHRQARRAELVAAAARAIETHGPDVHLADIAAEAGVSKPVLYRFFTDKDDLLAATASWGADRVLVAVTGALSADLPPRETAAAAVDAYLAEVEAHRNLFLLAVRHRAAAVDGSVTDAKTALAAVLARSLADALAEAGADTGGAEPWAHAIVGLGLSTAEWWLERGTMSRASVAGYLTDFIWHAFDGISQENSDIEGYSGAAELVDAGPDPVPVTVDLRGAFQPADGRYHWYGRIAASEQVDDIVTSGATVTVRTAYGEARAQVSDRDPWGRFRVTGTGRPPFPV